MNIVTIDPRDFIYPPYTDCPKCGKSFFGILMICPDKYFRLCRDCFYPRPEKSAIEFPLPALNKKVIYIDQFAISNMMKALNPDTNAHQSGRVDSFWIDLFRRLDRLCKLQLVVCPDSGFHMHESLLSPYFTALKQMYELLSHGISFFDHETIRRFQICAHAMNWISGNQQQELSLDVSSVVHGEINSWQDRIFITPNMHFDQQWIDAIRAYRESAHSGMNRVFQYWRSEKGKTFDDWFREEYMSFGRSTLQICYDYSQQFAASSKHSADIADILYPPSEIVMLHSIRDTLHRAGVPDSDIRAKSYEYLLSPQLQNVPFIKIASMLYAALARKAASGMNNPPNQGMNNDITLISVLLPYCNAMFIDNQCAALLMEHPLCDNLKYGAQIFCQNTKDAFISFLDSIESTAPPRHFEKVREVYGDDWPKPYDTLYEDAKN